MKQLPVMATRDFDHNGTSRKTGHLFWMSEADYAIWGGFVKIVPADRVPKPKVRKTEPKTTTKGSSGGYRKSQSA